MLKIINRRNSSGNFIRTCFQTTLILSSSYLRVCILFFVFLLIRKNHPQSTGKSDAELVRSQEPSLQRRDQLSEKLTVYTERRWSKR